MQDIPTKARGKRWFESSAVKILLGLSVFIASAGVFGLLSLNVVIKQGEKVTVPNVVNKSVVEALDLLSERGLELTKGGARNSSVVPENFILSQDPLPGSVVKEGWPVSVVISLGSKTALVPDLVGKSLREARVELSGSGLGVGRFSRIHHPSEPDTVLAQSPAPDKLADRETPVSMLVSMGPRPREYRMPQLVGAPLEKAGALLEAMGIELTDITTKVDLSHPQGTVIDQDPPPGSPVTEGSSVSLVMSTLYGEGERVERELTAFLYRVPYGFWPKTVRVEVVDAGGARTVYEEVDRPGATIELVIGYSIQCTIRVYIDGALETERVIR